MSAESCRSAGTHPPRKGTLRGRSQRPHTAVVGSSERSVVTVPRIITYRLMPTDEQWRLLRLRASQAASYANKHMQAKLAESLGWRPPDGARKDSVTKMRRAEERGDISANVYSACEGMVKMCWQRDARKVMAGAAMPQWKQADSLGIATITGAAGVKVAPAGFDRYTASLHVSAATAPPGWIDVPFSARTARDEYRWPILQEIAEGQTPILHARIVFKLHAGKTLLQLTVPRQKEVVPAGDRVATLSQLDDGRVLLRCERLTGLETYDLTNRLHALRELKDHWDAIGRRWRTQIGRRRGSAREKRRQNAAFRFQDRQSTALHQWSADIVRWCVAQGVGHLEIAGLVGGDWAAHELKSKLAYKCAEAGIELREPDLKTTTTADAADKSVKKKERKARKTREALRELETTI